MAKAGRAARSTVPVLVGVRLRASSAQILLEDNRGAAASEVLVIFKRRGEVVQRCGGICLAPYEDSGLELTECVLTAARGKRRLATRAATQLEAAISRRLGAVILCEGSRPALEPWRAVNEDGILAGGGVEIEGEPLRGVRSKRQQSCERRGEHF